MLVEFLLEEPSAEAALQELAPKLMPGAELRFHNFQGKTNLLKNLEARLRGFARWNNPDLRVVVLVDRDDDDCLELKGILETAAARAGLVTKTQAQEGVFTVLNRIAVEEVEAWFFGDVPAMKAAYSRLPASLGSKAKYRFPDGIVGGTWEALEAVLMRHGYHRGGLAKVQAAREIAPHMDPARNLSQSFQVFVAGLLTL